MHESAPPSPSNGPTDAELEEVARRIRVYRRQELLARAVASLAGLACAAFFIWVARPITGWLPPALLGLACGAPVYRILMPSGPPPED